MEAAIGVVLQVVRILEFMGLDVLVRNSELAHEGLRIALVGLRDGSRIRGYRQCLAAQHLVRGPGQVAESAPPE